MTGIMAAVAGTSENIIYNSGLPYGIYAGYAGTNVTYFDSISPSGTGVDVTPISASFTNQDASVLWRGYYRPATSGTYTFGFTATDTNANTQVYIWVGSAAKSGYTTGNALVSGTIGTYSNTYAVTAGLYYPIRIQYGFQDTAGIFQTASGSFTFLVNSSSTVTPLFYNSLTGNY